MERKANATAAVILSIEDFVNRLPRTPAAPGAFTKVELPAADPFVFRKQRGSLVKRTRKAAAAPGAFTKIEPPAADLFVFRKQRGNLVEAV